MKIICLCCFRNAHSYLPEFFSHLREYVDGFIVMNDRSDMADDSIAVTLDLKVITMLRRRSQNYAPFAYEQQNRRILLGEAGDEGADWVLCLDADERLELNFLRSMRELCESRSTSVISVRVRDIWNKYGEFRTDGIWGNKRKSILFDLNYCDDYKNPPIGLHQPWVNTTIQPVEHTDFNLYHLGSATGPLRAKRVRQHNQADPDKRWQSIGYDYLAKEDGLTLESIPEERLWYAV